MTAVDLETLPMSRNTGEIFGEIAGEYVRFTRCNSDLVHEIADWWSSVISSVLHE